MHVGIPFPFKFKMQLDMKLLRKHCIMFSNIINFVKWIHYFILPVCSFHLFMSEI